MSLFPSCLCVQDFWAGVRRGLVPVQRRSRADAAETPSRTFHAGSSERAHVPGVCGSQQPDCQGDHTHTLWVKSARRIVTTITEVTGSVFSLSHTHTVDVRHAFVLEGPCRSWVCATERGEDMDRFLSALRSAINSALTTDQWRGNTSKTRRFDHNKHWDVNVSVILSPW